MAGKAIVYAFLLLFLLLVAKGEADQLQDASTMKEKYAAWLVESNNDTSAVEWTRVYGASMLSNGSWSDVGMFLPPLLSPCTMKKSMVTLLSPLFISLHSLLVK